MTFTDHGVILLIFIDNVSAIILLPWTKDDTLLFCGNLIYITDMWVDILISIDNVNAINSTLWTGNVPEDNYAILSSPGLLR